MTETDDAGSVDAALAAIEQRARDSVKKKRWLVPVVVVIAGGVGVLTSQLAPDDDDHHTHHHHSTVGVIIGLAVVIAILIVAGIVMWKLRRRWARLLYWKNPPLAAGLNRRDRRTVMRDIRRGTPNADPVLRAVEIHTAERIRRFQPRWMLWLFSAIAAFMVVDALLIQQSTYGRVYYGITAVFFVAIGVAAFQQRRGIGRLLEPTQLIRPH